MRGIVLRGDVAGGLAGPPRSDALGPFSYPATSPGHSNPQAAELVRGPTVPAGFASTLEMLRSAAARAPPGVEGGAGVGGRGAGRVPRATAPRPRCATRFGWY